MVQHWSPRSQMEASLQPNEWFMVDRAHKIAVIRLLEVGGHKNKLYRSTTYSSVPSQRSLIGYFPTLDMAAYFTWMEWVRQHPTVTDRK